MPPVALRNIALVAHVDHGKTTLVDAPAPHDRGVQRPCQAPWTASWTRTTRSANAASRSWPRPRRSPGKGVKINLVDTPGHADFGGEVERALAMVDGVLLLVDAAEGPLPQTRYVLSKALDAGLPAVLVLNKVDRSDARADEVLDEVYELFLDLGAKDADIEFPIISAIAREGRAIAGVGVPSADDDLSPLLDAIVDTDPGAGRRRRRHRSRPSSPTSTRPTTSAGWPSDGSCAARCAVATGRAPRRGGRTRARSRSKRKLTELLGVRRHRAATRSTSVRAPATCSSSPASPRSRSATPSPTRRRPRPCPASASTSRCCA